MPSLFSKVQTLVSINLHALASIKTNSVAVFDHKLDEKYVIDTLYATEEIRSRLESHVDASELENITIGLESAMKRLDEREHRLCLAMRTY